MPIVWVGILLHSALALAVSATPWPDLARRLSGESENTKAKIIRDLRAIPDLKTQLQQGLQTSQRALALDVISALQLRDFMDELISQLADDQDGSIALTVNALLNRANTEKVTPKYVELLNRQQTLSPSFIVAALDPLGRLKVPLSQALLEKLLTHPFYEVRAAALYYVRLHMLYHHQTKYADLLAKAIKGSPYQLRLQALSIAGEVKDQVKIRPMLDSCLKDNNAAVRESCENLVKSESAP